jgi:hypothetical protein
MNFKRIWDNEMINEVNEFRNNFKINNRKAEERLKSACFLCVRENSLLFEYKKALIKSADEEHPNEEAIRFEAMNQTNEKTKNSIALLAMVERLRNIMLKCPMEQMQEIDMRYFATVYEYYMQMGGFKL